MTALDISKPIASICETLGFEPRNVLRLDMRPGTVSALVARVDAEGRKYIDPDTNDIAADKHTFEVVA